jgi:hypothetical protein
MNESQVNRREPMNQRAIRMPKSHDDQKRWILLTARDDDFFLEWVYLVGEGVHESQHRAGPLPYSKLWDALKEMRAGKAKYWLIGFGTQLAMNKADLFGALERREITLLKPKAGSKTKTFTGSFVATDRTTEIDLQVGQTRIKFLDWSNFGVHDGGMVESYANKTPEWSNQVWQDYLTALGTAGIVWHRPTAAQMGWHKMRRGGLSRALWHNPDTSARELERSSYFNGRCEPYFLGDVPEVAYGLDVKSCYAAICQKETVPIRMRYEYPDGVDVLDVAFESEDHWIAEVEVITDSPDYPMRNDDGRVYYPLGQFMTTLAWPELRHAIRHHRVVRITRAAKYESAIALQPFAEWCIKARQRVAEALDPKWDNVVKSIFNASLGYTARKHYANISIPNPTNCDWIKGTIPSPKDGRPVTCLVLDGHATWLCNEGEPREAIPYLHSTICSYARVHLLGLIETAGRQNVLYVDTDGLIVTQAGMMGLAALIDYGEAGPGDLVPRGEPGECRIQGQKSYRLSGKVTCAGLQVPNHHTWQKRGKLTTDTGHVHPGGRVYPLAATIKPNETEPGKWMNELH